MEAFVVFLMCIAIALTIYNCVILIINIRHLTSGKHERKKK